MTEVFTSKKKAIARRNTLNLSVRGTNLNIYHRVLKKGRSRYKVVTSSKRLN